MRLEISGSEKKITFLAAYRSLFSQKGLCHTTITIPIQLYDVPALLAAMNLLYYYTRWQEHVKN
jgi:hypothetical protein